MQIQNKYDPATSHCPHVKNGAHSEADVFCSASGFFGAETKSN